MAVARGARRPSHLRVMRQPTRLADRIKLYQPLGICRLTERGFSPPMQAASSENKKFGQPVVSDKSLVLPQEGGANQLLTPAQAAARFHIPEYLLRKACSEGRLEHLRVVNSLWLAPATVATFARSWRTKNGRNS